ncbi:MAG: InlB B-repeat-containing protein, partial [Bacteroidales bacterium]|nr:InlB B-repeat-containing protein [Bacteroidales bacterium]
NPYKLTVEGDSTYVALFRARARYTIAVDILPNGNAGTVTGDGQYREGRTVTLTAVPADGYTFVAWVNPALAAPKDTVSRNATYSFAASRNATFKAVFRRTQVNYTMTLNVTPAGSGTVDGDGSYRANASVTITATPNKGYTFVGWRNLANEYVSRDATYTFNITRNTTYTAVFRKKATYSVSLNVSPEEAGTVEGYGDYIEGENATIKATANPNYTFVEWQDEDGETVSEDAEYTFAVTTDVTYTALFERGPVEETYTVTVNVLPNLHAGTIEGGGIYKKDADVTITATPTEGYVFVAWMNGNDTLTKEPTYTFKAVADVIYTALFRDNKPEIPTYTITLNVLPNDKAGTVTGGGEYTEGRNVTITATPAEGYTFVQWQDATGKMVSTEASYMFKATANVTYSALFKESSEVKTYTVTLNVLPNLNAGTIEGGGTYKEGQVVTISAKPSPRYTFVAWMNGNDTLSKKPSYSFMVKADVTYTALFKENSANEQQLKAAFNVGAGNGQLFIENLNAVVVKEVSVFNTVGRQLAHFTPNSNANLALPVEARYSILVVRVVSEQGIAIYKVYLH